MKNIKIIFISSLILILHSCDLNLQPISEIGEGSFYKTTDEMSAAVIACYNGLQRPMQNEWMLTELRSDNSRLYNLTTTSTDNTLLFDFDQASVSATNQRVFEYWEAVYHNIARCNTVLKEEYLNVIKEDGLRNQFEGEARFIRAYHYFNLVRLFGPVFIVSERISAQEARDYDRSPIEDVYEFIIADLKSAIDKLPLVYVADQKGRATSWAAKSLLVKVYMTLGKIDNETLGLLEDIYQHSGHGLLPDYSAVFDISNEVNNEIIFAIRYQSGGIGLGSPFGNYFAPQLSGSSVINADGHGYNYPSMNLVVSYEEGDVRKDVTLAENYVNERGQTIDRMYVKKYLSPVLSRYDGDKDWPVLRFSDIILLYAEVLNELEGPSAALPYLNEVRERAHIPALKIEDFSNTHSMRMALEKERRVELAYENHRWFDLIHTNRVLVVLNTHFMEEEYYSQLPDGVPPMTESSIILPIPQKEIDVNQHITQNPGY